MGRAGRVHVQPHRLARGRRPTSRTYVEIDFERGDAVAVDGERLSPAALLTGSTSSAARNGIGRLDLVENRFVGMKIRGVYETPGGTILLAAHRGIESLTLDRGAVHLKDELMPRYAELVYNGFWFSPEREMLQALIDESQASVTGAVRLKLYKGTAQCRRPQVAEVPLPPGLRDLRGGRASTTRRTPKASSSSTRCACASRLGGIGN